MSTSNEQILIDYLDNSLEGAERLEAEQLILGDAAAAGQLETLRFSTELVREAAVLDQVMEVRKSFSVAARVVPLQQKNTGAVVRSFSKNVFRIAAMVVLVLGAASVYKYSSTTSAAVYNDNFSSFELSTSRGSNDDGELEKAYRSKNWISVEAIAAAQKNNNQKTSFLAGVAEMELKQYDKAITAFNNVMQLNQQTTAPYFQDEAEYYYALASLAANKPTEALAMLRKIRNDKEHLFNKKALAIPAIDLKVLDIKN
jgi:tetratricopeptide (TPR) repeat protein